MVELKPPPVLSGGLSGLAAPGWHLLTIAAARCWLLLAVLALAAGVVWRLNGFAPPLLSMLGGVGLALWCTALLLEPAWSQLQGMQSRHFAPSAMVRNRQYALASGVAAYAVPISLAALGTLLAFDTRLPVARILTLEQIDMPMSAGAFCTVVLLLTGPSLICLSLAVLAAGRAWLGQTGGTLVWAACLLALNSGMLWGTGLMSGPNLARLAELLRYRMNLVNFDPTKGMYLSDLLVEILLLPIAALVACTVLLAWSSIRPRLPRLEMRTGMGWIAALVALAAVCLASLLGTHVWQADSGVVSPGNWQNLLCLGATTLVISLALLRWTSNSRFSVQQANWQLLWSLSAAPAWVAYTLPNIYAGQAIQLDVLRLGAVALFVCAVFCIGILLIDRIFSESPAARSAAYLVVLALASIPIDPDYGTTLTSLIRQLNQALVFPEYRPLALPMASLLILMAAAGLWQLNKRSARRPAGRSGMTN